MYFFEHFLYRIAKSEYACNFIFKGGFLLETILGDVPPIRLHLFLIKLNNVYNMGKCKTPNNSKSITQSLNTGNNNGKKSTNKSK